MGRQLPKHMFDGDARSARSTPESRLATPGQVATVARLFKPNMVLK
jgi:hypothetical protein